MKEIIQRGPLNAPGPAIYCIPPPGTMKIETKEVIAFNPNLRRDPEYVMLRVGACCLP